MAAWAWSGRATDELADAQAWVMREARAAAKLHHGNVVTIFDVIEDDDGPWLVLEYVPSRSLAEVLADVRVLGTVDVARRAWPRAGGVAR